MADPIVNVIPKTDGSRDEPRPGAAIDRPVVEVVHSSETGVSMPRTIGGKPSLGRMQVIERGKQRRAEREAKESGRATTRPDPTQKPRTAPAPPSPPEPEVEPEPEAPPEGVEPEPEDPAPPADGEEEFVGSGPAGTEQPPTGDPESEPESEQESSATPDVAPELDAARRRAEEAEQRLATGRRGWDAERRQRHRDELETFVEDPVSIARAWLRERLGVDKDDDPAIADALAHLTEELTWGQVKVQDLPEAKKAQLQTARVGRQYRLQQHQRKADKAQRTREAFEEAVRQQARTSVERHRQEFPHLALSEDLGISSVEDMIVSTLMSAVQAGIIRRDANDEDAFKEALRLVDFQLQQRARRVATRMTPKATTGTSAKPGAVPEKKPSGTQPPASAPRAAPRAMPTARTGTAPSRPAEPAPPGPRIIDVSKFDDPEVRRRETLRKFRRQT